MLNQDKEIRLRDVKLEKSIRLRSFWKIINNLKNEIYCIDDY